jgi:hypothetical protein
MRTIPMICFLGFDLPLKITFKNFTIGLGVSAKTQGRNLRAKTWQQ